MIGVLRAEWIKLTTLRSHWVLMIFAVAFPLVVVALVGAFADERWTSHELGAFVVFISVFSSLLLAVFSATSLTAEFSHLTLRPTFAAVPGRARVFVTKALLNAVVVGAVITGILIASWIIGSSLLEGEFALGDRLSEDPGFIFGEQAGDTTVTARLLRAGGYAVLASLLALGLGLLLRNTALTVVSLLVWPLVGESILSLVF